MRRALGFLLIAVLACLAVVLPTARHISVPGHAIAAPATAPPRVGDCVQANTPPAPCDGVRTMEVVAVGVDVRAATSSCPSAARRYVGLPDVIADGEWRSLPLLQTKIVTPDAFHVIAGQHWVACVAYVGDTVLTATLAHALDAWSANALLSSCPYTPGLTELRDVQCSAPHRTEILGRIDFTSAPADLATTCDALALAATRMPDPTARGRLQITATRSTGSAVCEIQTTGRNVLAGSLLGLGSRPVPWG